MIEDIEVTLYNDDDVVKVSGPFKSCFMRSAGSCHLWLISFDGSYFFEPNPRVVYRDQPGLWVRLFINFTQRSIVFTVSDEWIDHYPSELPVIGGISEFQSSVTNSGALVAATLTDVVSYSYPVLTAHLKKDLKFKLMVACGLGTAIGSWFMRCGRNADSSNPKILSGVFSTLTVDRVTTPMMGAAMYAQPDPGAYLFFQIQATVACQYSVTLIPYH